MWNVAQQSEAVNCWGLLQRKQKATEANVHYIVHVDTIWDNKNWWAFLSAGV